MPGFRHCSFCHGKGCTGCDVEQKRFIEKAYASAPDWRDPDIRDIRDAWVRAEFERGMIGGGVGLDVMTEEQVEELFKPALDAEYARQFPDGPKPIFTARTDSPDDIRLLGMVAHREVIEKEFGPDGDGIEAIEKRAAVAGLIQQLRAIGD